MSKRDEVRGEKYLGSYLPSKFVNSFYRYVEERKKNSTDIKRLTIREILYEAVKSKMEADGFNVDG